MREGSKVVCINDDWPSGIEKYYTDLPVKIRFTQYARLRLGLAGMAWLVKSQSR